MASHDPNKLSRRERQIMDVLFRRRKATAAEILHDLPDPPSYSAVRWHLRTLEEKGHVRHRAEDLRYAYMPVAPRQAAMHGALRHLVATFFEGSASQAVAALLDTHSADLTPEELNHLSKLIEKAKREGR
jgi:predicted transcriptional regulator